jgi:8-oxo-dGTP diphosphatase
MKRYVAGFLFSPDKKSVVLVRKKRPDWQAGRLNGVGGSVEDGETPVAAMRREFMEEAGLDVPDWHAFGTVTGRKGLTVVHFFWAVGEVNDAKTMTDEDIAARDVDLIPPQEMVRAVAWMLPLARDGNVTAQTVDGTFD